MFSIPGNLSNLKVTEIHYHPLPEGLINDQEFEFIELKNTGDVPLDLSGFNFADGISYTFPKRTVLNVGKFIVLASYQSHFGDRYGFYAFDEFEGNLNNGGERLVAISFIGDTIINILFDDTTPWPLQADGQGYSLVPKEFDPQSDQNDPNDWRASLDIHGSPGRNDEPNTNIDNESDKQIINYDLAQNYPNPFNPKTVIRYVLPVTRYVNISVYNLLGQKITMLVDDVKQAGHHSVEWDAENMSSGIYFYRLEADGFSSVKKMMLMK